MRTVDEITADMAEIAAQDSITQEDLATYMSLESELLAAQQAAGSSDGDAAPEPEPAPAVPAPATVAPASPHAVAAMRARHQNHTRVVVPAGRPSNRAQETEADGFRAYLRTGKPNADLRQAPQNAQGTGTGSAGGFLVPETFVNRIVEVVKSFGGVFNDAEQLITDSGNPLRFPKNDDTSNQATVATENAAPASGADAVFDDIELGAFEYAASGTGGNALQLPIALVQDSALDIEAFMSKLLGRRIARKMGNDAVLGIGTGGAQGILQGVSGTAVAASTLAYADLVSLAMSIDPYYWTGAKWYMNAASLGVVMQLEDGAGQLIFKPGFAMIGDGNATQISGQIQVGGILAPVVIETALPTFAASGSVKWAAFGNINEAYIWRQVRQIEVLVDPYSSANLRRINYNAFVRADGRQKDTAAYAVSKTAA